MAAARTASRDSFIEPTVIADVKAGRDDRAGRDLWTSARRDQGENYDDALKIANDTQFGLTGAVYSRTKQSSIARAESFMSAICI
jgi:acyl-CoA reductase-like NAD-dependent aldehyde dehydrogenase